ncbi:MAG: signal peptidase II [Deltaproteobacteria bacterium]|nr:signal peptidase II [Deltaproteobacteria bacterium]
MLSHRRRVLFFFVTISTLLVADQLTKLWAVRALTHVQASHPGTALEHYSVLHPVPARPLFFAGRWGYFEYAENPGAAWNILSGAHESFRYPFFFVVGIVAMTLMTIYYFRAKPEERLRRVALACIIGGALGNFADRMRLRYVIDFVVVDLGSFYRWPTFNFADAAVSIGVVLLVAESFKKADQPAARA